MPSVRLLLNVGLPDGRRLGLATVREGDVLDVSPDAAAEMLRRGWAEALDPPADADDDPASPDDDGLDSKSRAELFAIAKSRGVPFLVNQSTVDILAAIRKAGAPQ